MAFATANSPANRKPGDNAQTATPPQAQARPRQSPGKAEPRARQTPPARTGTKTWWVRCRPCSGESTPPSHARPPRAPGRKPGSGALAGPSSEFPRRRIVNLVQPWSKLTIFRSFKAKMHDYLRYRKAHTRTTDRNVHFSLPRPRKTVCFDRQRPKPTVFRIPHPTDSQPHSQQVTLPSPISAMEGFFARLKNTDNGNRVLPPSDWSGVTIPEFCRILDAYLRH